MSQAPRERLDWRVSVTAVTGVVVGICMVLFGMEPRLALVGIIVTAIGAVTWLLVDLGSIASPLVWTDHGPDIERAPRPDRRVRALRGQLRTPARRRRAAPPPESGRTEPVDDVVDTLVELIDDHLLDEFGIDRSTDPAAAAEVLGPDLTGFVTDPAARRSMSGRRSLARTVGLIEDLCARSHTG